MNVQSINDALQTCAPFAVPVIMLAVSQICWVGGGALKEEHPVISYLLGISSVLLAPIAIWILGTALVPRLQQTSPMVVIGFVVIYAAAGMWMFASSRRPTPASQQTDHA